MDTSAARTIYGDDALLPTLPKHVPHWKTDLIAGLPTTLRLSRQIGESKLWAEAGAGFYVLVPTFFAGLRCDSDLYVGRCHSWHVSPGLDFYFSPRTSMDSGSIIDGEVQSLGAAIVDFDLIWRVRWHERFRSHLGLKIGAGVAAGAGAWGPVPVLGLMAGCQF